MTLLISDPYAGTRQYNYDRQDGRNDARYVSNPQQRAPVVENFGNNTLGSTLQTVPSMPYAESNEQSLPPPPQEFSKFIALFYINTNVTLTIRSNLVKANINIKCCLHCCS